MTASKQDPSYKAALIDLNGTHYDLSGITLSIALKETDGQLAQMATIKVVNIYANGHYLNGIFVPRCRVFVYADDGEKQGEVFRGFVWEQPYKSSTEKELTLICYDQLIYFQRSEESIYFSSGKSTKSICESICSDWGVNLEYTYESITHGKMPLRGTLSDLFLTDLLAPVKKQTGKRFVIRSEKDVVKIMPAAGNADIYEIIAGKNAIDTNSVITMEGMVTKVKILGEEDNNGRSSVEAAAEGDVSLYGTLQKIVTRNTDTSLSDAKAEAEETIKEKGLPQKTWEVRAVDIPWVRKGDKVWVSAGNLHGNYIVLGVAREISKEKIMTLTLEAM